MKEMHLIVDLQFGSCGKGLFAGYLAEHMKPDTAICAFGPNAGHTFIDGAGRKFVNIALPNGIVSPNLKRVLLGPGSVINPERLIMELNDYADLLPHVRVMIHQNAAVVTQAHRDDEAAYGFKIGSTMKGAGAAVINKIRRDPGQLNVASVSLRGTPLEPLVVSTQEYNNAVDSADRVLIEGAQGFSLSINQGMYPYTTSRDCTVTQVLSDCAIPFGRGTWRNHMVVYGVCRTYPIRVANRFDADGKQIGTSGPHYHDQREITWAEVNGGMEPELTTVTKLPRRVFTFSMEQVRQAIRANGCDKIFLNFLNYMNKEDGRTLAVQIGNLVKPGPEVRYLGYGPTVNDIKEV